MENTPVPESTNVPRLNGNKRPHIVGGLIILLVALSVASFVFFNEFDGDIANPELSVEFEVIEPSKNSATSTFSEVGTNEYNDTEVFGNLNRSNKITCNDPKVTDALRLWQVGKQYGSFVYEGYECQPHATSTIEHTNFYFSGTTTVTGHMNAVGDHIHLDDDNTKSLPFKIVKQKIGSTFWLREIRHSVFDEIPVRYGNTITAAIDGLVFTTEKVAWNYAILAHDIEILHVEEDRYTSGDRYFDTTKIPILDLPTEEFVSSLIPSFSFFYEMQDEKLLQVFKKTSSQLEPERVFVSKRPVGRRATDVNEDGTKLVYSEPDTLPSSNSQSYSKQKSSTLYTYDLATGETTEIIKKEGYDPIYAPSWSPSGRFVISIAPYGKTTYTYKVAFNTLTKTENFIGEKTARIFWFPDQDKLISVGPEIRDGFFNPGFNVIDLLMPAEYIDYHEQLFPDRLVDPAFGYGDVSISSDQKLIAFTATAFFTDVDDPNRLDQLLGVSHIDDGTDFRHLYLIPDKSDPKSIGGINTIIFGPDNEHIFFVEENQSGYFLRKIYIDTQEIETLAGFPAGKGGISLLDWLNNDLLVISIGDEGPDKRLSHISNRRLLVLDTQTLTVAYLSEPIPGSFIGLSK